MTTMIDTSHGQAGEHGHHDASDVTIFGFWVYLMTDCVLFGGLFTSYISLHGNLAGGPSSKELFELPFVFVETMLLLLSSCTFGFAMLALHQGKQAAVKGWLVITFLLGAGFIGMELYEFHHLVSEGFGPGRSAFLSGFFTLVGTHGIHVTVGLVWIIVMFLQVSRWGLTPKVATRMTCLSLFWHFLDIVWICVFTFVYLMGTI